MATEMQMPAIRPDKRRIDYTTQEVAAMTGFHVITLQQKAKKGEYGAFRLGKRKWMWTPRLVSEMTGIPIEELP